MTDKERVTAKELRADRGPLLYAVWVAWVATLPPEAIEAWRRGCAYVRQSSIKSLHASAPDVQLRSTLVLLAAKQVYVPWEGVFFDNASGTDVKLRSSFRALYEQAIAGGFEVVGYFVSERLFRNLEQASRFKREFRRAGITLEYLGKFEGDPRNPAAWQLETMQDMAAEAQARTTGFYVGTSIEDLTRRGHPVGRLPEAYKIAGRSPSFLGRQGSATRWELVEPLASIIAEGKDRYLAGASYTVLARWSETTELHGKTPEGATLNAWWWKSTLHNPKYAGFQMPTAYQGFQPGVNSPARPRLGRNSDLVPCLLPALWTLEDYEAIWAEGEKRLRTPKTRRTYRSYLLTGITYDERCDNHRMSVHNKRPDGRFWMVCRHLGTGGRDGSHIRADVAERELDALLSGLTFTDEPFLRQVEDELRELINVEGGERALFRANPAIAGILRAVTELRAVGLENAVLSQQLKDLEAADLERQAGLAAPVVGFRAALNQIRNWPAVWREADMDLKNKLLREAGIRVTIGRDPGEDHAPAHIKSIAADNPVMAMALAAALTAAERAYGDEQPSLSSNASVLIDLGVLATSRPELTRDLGGSFDLRVKRPLVELDLENLVPGPRQAASPYSPFAWRARMTLRSDDPRRLFTVADAAASSGAPAWFIYRLIERGHVRVVRTGPRGGRILVPQPEVLSAGLMRGAEQDPPDPDRLDDRGDCIDAPIAA